MPATSRKETPLHSNLLLWEIEFFVLSQDELGKAEPISLLLCGEVFVVAPGRERTFLVDRFVFAEPRPEAEERAEMFK